MSILSKVVGLDKIIEIVEKLIPDTDLKKKLKLELTKLEVEDYKNKKGSRLEKVITSVFPAMGYTFVAIQISNLIAQWIGFICKTEAPIFPVDADFYRIIWIYVGGFFGKKTFEKITKK